MLGGHLNKGFFSGYRLRPTLSTVAFVVPLECSIAPNSGLTFSAIALISIDANSAGLIGQSVTRRNSIGVSYESPHHNHRIGLCL